MDLYISSTLLGAAGLGVMALSGLGAHGNGGGAHAGHAHLGHEHIGHEHGGHGEHGGNAGHSNHGARAFWLITSPRFLFSFALGFGVVGDLARSVLGGPALLAAALVGGLLFERLIVTPLWNFAMRFASRPALTLESAIADEATAVTSFDAQGHGIVSLEVDGQIVQVLATLQPADRDLGVRVRAGQRVRIEDVSPTSNQCTVSAL